MSYHAELKSLAKLVAKDVRKGALTAGSHHARDFMEADPDAVLEVIDLVQREANRKTPDEAMIQAYSYLFFSGMQSLRFQIERQLDCAAETLDEVRDLLHLLAASGAISPELLMLLLNAVIEAKLDPGEDLSALLQDLALGLGDDSSPADPADLGEALESIVEQAGGNVFDIFMALSETSQALPPELRQAMMEQMLTSDNAVLRDTGVLYLLDPAPQVRRGLCQHIAQQTTGAMVSPTGLRRMIALRNWVPEGERQHLDKAIKEVRQKQKDCASWPQRQVEKIFASNMDGAGAQSVFAVVKEGRKRVIACLLVKQGVGIADAWCIRDQSSAEAKEFLRQVCEATLSVPVDMDFLQVLLPHFLAVGQKAANTPAPGLLDFVESVGIETWQPQETSVDQLLALLEKDADSKRVGEKGTTELLKGRGDWFTGADFTESWFEDDALVARVLSAMPRSKNQARVNAVIKSVLEPRREKWAEQFLWTAFWLKQVQDLLSPWMEFFVVGRELHKGRPVLDIKVMRNVARVTVMAATAGRR